MVKAVRSISLQPAFPWFQKRWRVTPWWRRESPVTTELGLLRVLLAAHQERLPLVTLVKNYALEHRGTRKRRLLRLANRMAAGTPLVSALEQTPEVLSDGSVLAIRFGSQCGVLDAALADQIQQRSRQWARFSRGISDLKVYGAAMFFLLLLGVSFLGYFIYPTQRMILDEFDMEVPELHAIEFWLSRFLRVAPLLMWIGLIAILIWRFSPLRRVLRRRFASRLSPSVSRARRAELLRLLALGLEHGRPIISVVSTLAHLHYDPSIRRRLLVVHNDLAQGEQVWDSLRRQRLVSPEEAKAISQAKGSELPAWVLRKRAQQDQEAWTWHVSHWLTVAKPILILLFAALVLVIAYSQFQFLAKIIHGLA